MASYLEKPVAIQRADVSYGAIEFARLFDDVFSEGVVGTNDLKVQQYSGGARMSVEVAAGSAYVDFDTPDKGKYRVYNSALNDSGTPGAPNNDWEATFLTADATNPRVDRVVLLVYDGNYDGTGKYKGVFKVITGTPTAGATLVNLNGAAAVPSNAILLANVLVAAAATTIPTANIDTTLATVRPQSRVGSGAAAAGTSYGTTLPAAPIDGQEHILVDSTTNPTYQWRFRYNAGSTSPYKWEFGGGAAAVSEVAATDNIASAAYVALATAGPAVALPRPGDYDVEIGAHCAVGKAGSLLRMSYDIGATGAVNADSVEATSAVVASGQFYDYMGVARPQRKTGLGAVTLTSKYLSGDATAAVYYIRDRFMRVTPVRVS